MKSRNWLIGCLTIFFIVSIAVSALVYQIDPYFHYHAPNTDSYYYEINNQRSQNDGIIKHFNYNALITGTSLTIGFKTSEADQLFNHQFIKIPFNGASFKEINDNINTAINENPNLNLVIRGIDMNMFGQDKDAMRYDLGDYPTYLYNNNPFDDVEYLLNREIAFGLSYNMINSSKTDDFNPGITSFDDYSYYDDNPPTGINNVISDKQVLTAPSGNITDLSDAEKSKLVDNINQNLVSVAKAHPEIEFYYFYTPYSIAFWNTLRVDGTLEKQLEKEKIVTELLLQNKNIHLFSFNMLTDITTDLTNYVDTLHYVRAINSLMLEFMSKDEHRLTTDNYSEYLKKEHDFYTNFDYSSLLSQYD